MDSFDSAYIELLYIRNANKDLEEGLKIIARVLQNGNLEYYSSEGAQIVKTTVEAIDQLLDKMKSHVYNIRQEFLLIDDQSKAMSIKG